MISTVVHWPTGPVSLEWHPQHETTLPVTGCHSFVFGASGLVVAKVASRGVTIPGGHVESLESVEQCARREIAEEIQVDVGSLHLIGHIICDHSVNPDYSGPYPNRGSQAIYFCKVRKYHEFKSDTEVTQRLEISRRDLPTMHHEWNIVLGAAYTTALSMADRIK